MKKKNTPGTTEAWDAWNTTSARYLVATIVLVIVTIVWIASYIVQPVNLHPGVSNDRFPGGGVAEDGHLPGMTEADIMEQMQREADKGVFAFKINSRPVFSSGKSEGTLRIENPNHNAYPFVVKIFLKETSEEIYNSGGILPNHHIETAKLTKVLPKGEHAATAYIYAYNPETNEYEGKAAVDLTMVITL